MTLRLEIMKALRSKENTYQKILEIEQLIIEERDLAFDEAYEYGFEDGKLAGRITRKLEVTHV